MAQYWWIPVLVLVLGLSAVLAALPSWRRRRHRLMLIQARQTFFRRREWLEARFVTLASQSGKPRGLEWVNCDFDSEVRFARDRDTGNLRALVGVTISFRAIEGGGMEDVEAVSNLRAATAVFLFENQQWTTIGRVLFNVNPDEAIARYQHELETVD
jgi:hypothetical protein